MVQSYAFYFIYSQFFKKRWQFVLWIVHFWRNSQVVGLPATELLTWVVCLSSQQALVKAATVLSYHTALIAGASATEAADRKYNCQVVKCMELYRIPRPDSPEDWRAVFPLIIGS